MLSSADDDTSVAPGRRGVTYPDSHPSTLIGVTPLRLVSLHLQPPPHLFCPLVSSKQAMTDALMPLKELLNDEVFMSKVENTARLFYQNSVLTIDTHIYFLWGSVILAVLLALAYLIFGDWSKLDFIGTKFAGSSGSGYGTAYQSEDMLNELQNQVRYQSDLIYLFFTQYQNQIVKGNLDRNGIHL